MTVALDATYSISDHLSGVGFYSREILNGLAEAHPEARFEFWYRPHRFVRSFRERFPRNVHRRLLAEPLGPRRAELFHGLNQRLPKLALRRAVATFHDLFMMTSEYSTPEFRERFTAQARDAATRADAIIAVSEFTRSQVIALLGVEPDRVHVVHHGVHALQLPALSREQIVLSVGAIQKRKNVARLVEAFESLDASWRLVLAGSYGFGAGEILERIHQSPARDRITVTGYASGERLLEWYARASVFAFPSLDEGFGMPVLEAMAAGIPVLTGTRSSLPEVAGDAALLVDPTRTEEIVDGLRRLTRDEELRCTLSERGRERARLFTWENACRQTWQIYRTVIN